MFILAEDLSSFLALTSGNLQPPATPTTGTCCLFWPPWGFTYTHKSKAVILQARLWVQVSQEVGELAKWGSRGDTEVRVRLGLDRLLEPWSVLLSMLLSMQNP